MEMCLIPLILLPSSAHSSLPACAQLWVPHTRALKKTLQHLPTTTDNSAKYPRVSELLGEMEGVEGVF